MEALRRSTTFEETEQDTPELAISFLRQRFPDFLIRRYLLDVYQAQGGLATKESVVRTQWLLEAVAQLDSVDDQQELNIDPWPLELVLGKEEYTDLLAFLAESNVLTQDIDLPPTQVTTITSSNGRGKHKERASLEVSQALHREPLTLDEDDESEPYLTMEEDEEILWLDKERETELTYDEDDQAEWAKSQDIVGMMLKDYGKMPILKPKDEFTLVFAHQLSKVARDILEKKHPELLDQIEGFNLDYYPENERLGVLYELMGTDVELIQSLFEAWEAKRIKRGNVKKAIYPNDWVLSIIQNQLMGSARIQDEKTDILMKWAQLGPIVEDHLVKANLRWTVSVAKKYMGRGLPFGDLVNIGSLGLMIAVTKYDVSKGNKLTTYATWWIRQQITREIAEQSRTIRIPVHMSDRIKKMWEVSDQLESELMRKPTPDEIGTIMNLPPKKVRWMMKVSQNTKSLSDPVKEGEETELEDFIEDPLGDRAETSAEQRELSEVLGELLTKLTPREVKIIRLRFGLNGDEPLTLDQVALKMGFTREGIRQIETKALIKLRIDQNVLPLRNYIRPDLITNLDTEKFPKVVAHAREVGKRLQLLDFSTERDMVSYYSHRKFGYKTRFSEAIYHESIPKVVVTIDGTEEQSTQKIHYLALPEILRFIASPLNVDDVKKWLKAEKIQTFLVLDNPQAEVSERSNKFPSATWISLYDGLRLLNYFRNFRLLELSIPEQLL